MDILQYIPVSLNCNFIHIDIYLMLRVERGHNYINKSNIQVHILQVFSNMTSNIRKALFKSLMAQSIENENAVVIDNGEEVSMEGGK